MFRRPARVARRAFDPNCRLRKFNNAKGQLGSAHQSDNSFTKIQYQVVNNLGSSAWPSREQKYLCDYACTAKLSV